MTEVDPIVGPGHTDEVVFLARPGELPEQVRVTWQQVPPGTEGAVALPWVPDQGMRWLPLAELPEAYAEYRVSEEEYLERLAEYEQERQELIEATTKALRSLGLSDDQVGLLMEGK